MNKSQFEEVYRRVQQFSLDDPNAVLPFSRKLAKENGWTAQYTQRVIDEYKKFVVLAVLASHPVTPSEQVDQVWHLHLTYTHSYWDKFCTETLQKPLHHYPNEWIAYALRAGCTTKTQNSKLKHVPPSNPPSPTKLSVNRFSTDWAILNQASAQRVYRLLASKLNRSDLDRACQLLAVYWLVYRADRLQQRIGLGKPCSPPTLTQLQRMITRLKVQGIQVESPEAMQAELQQLAALLRHVS